MDRPPGSPRPAAPAPVPLYGREHDLCRLLALLHGGARLLTLRGPGGIGKTALAQHVLQALHAGPGPTFDHLRFIDLSGVREPEQVTGVIAASVPDRGSRGDATRRIQAFTAGRRALLVLDNFEHVLSAAAALGDLLDAAPSLQLLVTSRSALRLHAEVEYPVQPLDVAHRVCDAASSAAVQLLVARVQALAPTFTLTEGNAAQVTRLCGMLEGVPLALELAAMRTRTYALGDLLARLEHPLEVLKADVRDRPERLQSLRAAVQWSYDLLGDADRAVFACCAVFDGPFGPGALEAVWGSPDVLDRAESLLSQSFLHRLDTPGTLWKLLQPLRELAVEQLDGHPHESVWRERHARYYLTLVEGHQEHVHRHGLGSEEAYLPHYPNIRAGLVWAAEARRSDLAYRFLGAAGGLWAAYGVIGQDGPLVERVLALPPPESRVALLRALEVSAMRLDWLGELQACETRLGEVVALCRELGDVEGEIRAHSTLAVVVRDAGQPERAWEIRQWIFRTLRGQAAHLPPGRGLRMHHAHAHLGAAQDLLELGRYAQALEYARQAAQHFLDVGSREGRFNARTVEGLVLLHLRRLPDARALLLACVREAVQDGVRGMVDHALRWGLIYVAAEQREWTTLVQFTAFVNDPVGERSQGALDRRLQRAMGLARAELGETAYRQAWTAGTRLQPQDILERTERLAGVPSSPAGPHPALTPREREVLALVSQGHPDRRVARLLDISPATASKHVGNILGKLGLRNRVELTRWAIEHLPPDERTAGPPGR